MAPTSDSTAHSVSNDVLQAPASPHRVAHGSQQTPIVSETPVPGEPVVNAATSSQPALASTSVSTHGMFSRAERERSIVASKETAADRERVSITANAVLSKAFSADTTPSFGQLPDEDEVSKGDIRRFSNVLGSFSETDRERLSVAKSKYKGTNRGEFHPPSFDTFDDGRIVLQSIGLTAPYLHTSFEELRLGDYFRGRKKAPHLFEPFDRLPVEVRCMIWRLAMAPRTIELRHDIDVTKPWTPTKVPVLLQVSQESRQEALKRYTLAFGTRHSQSKIYFDFARDALFLTYEKWHGEGQCEAGTTELAAMLAATGDAMKIRHLAIDKDLLEYLAQILDDEEEEWYAVGDEDATMPEMVVIPAFTSLKSLAIVTTKIDALWQPDEVNLVDCHDGEECDCYARGEKNDNAVMVSSPEADATYPDGEYYKEMIIKIKRSRGDAWEVPELEYLAKKADSQRFPEKLLRRNQCTCSTCLEDGD